MNYFDLYLYHRVRIDIDEALGEAIKLFNRFIKDLSEVLASDYIDLMFFREYGNA